MFSVILSLMLICGSFTTQGCLMAAAIHAAGSSKEEAATKDAEAKNMEAYNAYKTEMEKSNLDRQKAGLKPQPIQTFEEWKLSQPAPEPKK